MKILRSILTLLVLLISARDGYAISSFRADYDISKGRITVGTLSRQLTLTDDQRYRYESRMAPRGLVALFAGDEVVEVSSGRIEQSRFMPERYSYEKGGSRKDFELDFDYDSNTVHLLGYSRSWSASMPTRILDKLVYQAQLMLDLPGAPETLVYDIADKGKLKHYRIVNLGQDMTETGLGTLRTVKLQRADPDSQRRTIVWCAEELDWMPVKVEYRDSDGSVTVAVLDTLQAR